MFFPNKVTNQLTLQAKPNEQTQDNSKKEKNIILLDENSRFGHLLPTFLYENEKLYKNSTQKLFFRISKKNLRVTLSRKFIHLLINQYSPLKALQTFQKNHKILNTFHYQSLGKISDKSFNNKLINKNLIEAIDSKETELQNELLKIENPILIEQIINLSNILKNKSEKKFHKIINFILLTIQKSENLDEPIAMIGKMTFLTEKNYIELMENLSIQEYESSLSWINTAFSNRLEDSLQSVENHYQNHLSFGLQSAEIALHTYLPIVISQLLLTEIGTINLGIIDLLLNKFLAQPHDPKNFEINLVYGLELLKKSYSFRSKIENLKAPTVLNTFGQRVVQTTLKLPCDEPITDLQTKQTVLSALLSHLRQTVGRTCFAESLAIELLSSQLEQCLDDFCSLLNWGHLTRKINGSYVNFPFLLRLDNQSLDHMFTINQKGELTKEKESFLYLWKAPGVKAACQAMGVIHPKKAIKEFLKEKWKKNEESVQINLWQLLNYLSRVTTSSPTDAKELFNYGCFALDSELAHPLLKVWRNAIAGMAEAEEDGMIKSAIVNAILHGLKVKIKGIKKNPIPILKKISLKVEKEVKKRTQILYDPYLLKENNPLDHASPETAFILYDSCNELSFTNWIRIDSFQEFQKYMERILLSVKEMPSRKYFKKSKNELSSHIIDLLIRYVQQEKFIQRVLHKYHAGNDPKLSLSKFDQVQYAPWVTKSGNNTNNVLKIYLDKKIKNTVKIAFPKKAVFLLKRIIDVGKNLPLVEKNAYLENRHKLIPLKINGLHSFSLMLGHPSLIKSWNNEIPTTQWIKEFVLDPGIQVSNSPLSNETLQGVAEFCKKKLVPEEDLKKFSKRISELPEEISNKKFREYLVLLLEEYIPLEKNLSEERARIIDCLIYRFLPNISRQRLEDSTIHFADTNWGEGIHDAHFCFLVNPGTGELEIWETYDDGSRLIALNQQYWLYNRTWEFLSNPEILFPQNETLHLKN